MHNKIKKNIIMLAFVLTAGIIYYFLYNIGVSIPCIFHSITGFYCPGCGVTRMCVNIIKLDFYNAFRSNPAVFCIIPILVAIFIRKGIYMLKYGEYKKEKWINIIEIILIAIMIIFGILRNIPAFYFLRPI